MGGASVVAAGRGSQAAGRHSGRIPGIENLRALYRRHGALLGYALAAVVAGLGWAGRGERNIDAGHGLGYALGILGGSLMLLLLLYSARKRVRLLARVGATRHWFRIHMMLGIIGPLLILYHCNFSLGDLNSQVALFCTLLVAGSGIVGRYLYAGIHNGLYGSKSELRDLVKNLQVSLASDRGSDLIAPIRAELSALDERVLSPPAHLGESLLRPLVIGWQTWLTGRRLLRITRRELMRKAMTSPAVDQHADRLADTVERYLREHLALVRQVTRFNSFERLFALWHVVHVPFFIMMILSALFHVFAVHFF